MGNNQGISNREQYAKYRQRLESDLKRPDGPIATGRVGWTHMAMISPWTSRYLQRRYVIEGTRGWGDPLIDTSAAEALIARNLAKDAEWPQLPEWDEETWFFINNALKNNPAPVYRTVSSVSEPCKYGPSLRRLWGEAKARGATDDEAWRAIYDWGKHRPAAWQSDDARKRRHLTLEQVGPGPRLEQAVTWQKASDLDFPWRAERDGARWQVRINDFPDEHMYTLFVNGESMGDFDDWPDTWDRGDRRVEAVRPQARPAVVVHGRFLERYLVGEYEVVWKELVSLGPEVRSPQYRPAAEAVARETMRRARHNVELLIQRLEGMGYRFWVAKPSGRNIADHLKDKDVFAPPDKREKKELDKWERRGVILPLSVRMWIEEVGRVDLAGSHPTLSFLEHAANFHGVYADPLMVIPDADSMEDMMAERMDQEDKGKIDLFLSFDAHDKAWVGSNELLDSEYSIEVPNESADALLKGEGHGLYFVEYLRRSFQWGGFPGWEEQAQRPERELAALRDGLLAI